MTNKTKIALVTGGSRGLGKNIILKLLKNQELLQQEIEEKYNNLLVVLGINSGDTKEKIEKFITPKNYAWKQLLAGTDNDNLVLKFNVTGFPTKFIIAPFRENFTPICRWWRRIFCYFR